MIICRTLATYKGRPLLDAPRTDPDEPDSSIRLLPRVCDGEAPLRRLPYAAQRLGHACPALGPERALLVRVPLGPRPWLHRLTAEPEFCFAHGLLAWDASRTLRANRSDAIRETLHWRQLQVAIRTFSQMPMIQSWPSSSPAHPYGSRTVTDVTGCTCVIA